MMSEVLRNPHPCDHLIQAYTDDRFLAKSVAEYIGSGLQQGEGAVIIATPAHVAVFTSALSVFGIDVPAVLTGRQLVVLDAERTLEKFMLNGRPDRATFLAVVAAALDHVATAGRPNIRLYGEMVDLLWRDNVDATVELEQLWNEVLADTRLSLLCAYSLDPLDHRVSGVMRQVTRCHSRLTPAQDHERFEEAVERAYGEVFGVPGDVAALRELMVSRNRLETTMPAAHAALFALDSMPAIISNEVRARARAHYGRRKAAPARRP